MTAVERTLEELTRDWEESARFAREYGTDRRTRGTLGAVEEFSSIERSLKSHHQAYTLRRDEAIRAASAEGTPQRELARITGLSRAQIQRICDLSGKDKS